MVDVTKTKLRRVRSEHELCKIDNFGLHRSKSCSKMTCLEGNTKSEQLADQNGFISCFNLSHFTETALDIKQKLEATVSAMVEGNVDLTKECLFEMLEAGGPEASGAVGAMKFGVGLTVLCSGHLLVGGAMAAWGVSAVAGATFWGRNRKEVNSWMHQLGKVNKSNLEDNVNGNKIKQNIEFQIFSDKSTAFNTDDKN